MKQLERDYRILHAIHEHAPLPVDALAKTGDTTPDEIMRACDRVPNLIERRGRALIVADSRQEPLAHALLYMYLCLGAHTRYDYNKFLRWYTHRRAH